MPFKIRDATPDDVEALADYHMSCSAAETETTSAIFSALSHSSRRQILLNLRVRGGSMTAGEIAQSLSCAWPTTTRHLQILESAGLVQVEKNGRGRIYTLDLELLKRVTLDWLRWFEEGV